MITWGEEFSRQYGAWSAGMTADIPFYVDLAREADGPIIELAIGNARVAIPIAQATGQTVIGIDSSPLMLDQARANAAAATVRLDLRAGDMARPLRRCAIGSQVFAHVGRCATR